MYYLEDRLGFGARLGQADAKLRPALNLELVNRFEFAKEYFALAYWSPVGLAAGWELLLRLSPGFYLQFGSSGRAQLLRSGYWTGPLPGEGAGKPLLASTPVGFMLGRNIFLSAADFAFGIRMEL